MKTFEDNNHVCSVRLRHPEAIFRLRGQMVGQKWVKSDIHHFSIIGYNSPIKCAIWVHNTILETSGHLVVSSKPKMAKNGQKYPPEGHQVENPKIDLPQQILNISMFISFFLVFSPEIPSK